MDGYHESRRCSMDTYPESHITKYTSIRRLNLTPEVSKSRTVKILAYTLRQSIHNSNLFIETCFNPSVIKVIKTPFHFH